LPKIDNVYPQMPYEEITKEEYLEKASKLTALNLGNTDASYVSTGDPQAEKFCDGDKCAI
jgi:ribonucleoside-triphosphate reductase